MILRSLLAMLVFCAPACYGMEQPAQLLFTGDIHNGATKISAQNNFSSIYRALIPLLSNKDVVDLSYLLDDDLFAHEGAILSDRHTIFIKHVIHVMANEPDAYSEKSIRRRLSFLLDVKTPGNRATLTVRKKLDDLLAQPTRQVAPQFGQVLSRFLLTYLTDCSVIDGSFDYSRFSIEEYNTVTALLAMQKIPNICKEIVKECIKNIYRLCIENISNQLLVERIREREYNIRKLVTSLVSYGGNGDDSEACFDPLLSTQINGIEKCLDLLTESQLRHLIHLCANPFLRAHKLQGLVLKFMLICPEARIESNGFHELLKKYVRNACFRSTRDSNFFYNDLLITLKALLEGKLDTGHKYHLFSTQHKWSQERRQRLLDIVTGYKKSFTINSTGLKRTALAQSPVIENPEVIKQEEKLKKPKKDPAAALESFLNLADDTAEQFLSQTETDETYLNTLLLLAIQKSQALTLELAAKDKQVGELNESIGSTRAEQVQVSERIAQIDELFRLASPLTTNREGKG